MPSARWISLPCAFKIDVCLDLVAFAAAHDELVVVRACSTMLSRRLSEFGLRQGMHSLLEHGSVQFETPVVGIGESGETVLHRTFL